METPMEYLISTKSAAVHLLSGINDYLQILQGSPSPAFVGTFSNEEERNSAFEQWRNDNAIDIQKGLARQRNFMAERIALATLCGSLLQIASMAITRHSKKAKVPTELSGFVKEKYAKFCIGRPVRDVPLGLVILAGRNQYNHIDDYKLREPNSTVFERLATRHGNRGNYRDPAFDLNAKKLWYYAFNITDLMGWRKYEIYENDMRSMLEI